MNSTVWIAYLVLAGVSLVQALLLALQAWEHRRYARSCLGDVAGYRPRGRAMILAPCRGAEVALEENLRGLLRQDYDDYEVTFIVEDAGDAAATVIRRVLAEHPAAATRHPQAGARRAGAPGARLLVAGLAAEGGQKVHNLRAATAALPPGIRYLVFVDSDAQPRPEWLRSLLARLWSGEAAVVTGYRWFMPCRGALAEKIVYTINCTIMSLLGRSSHYLVWGGSWAIRRDTFDSLGLHAAWKGTLSDDLVAAQVLREARCAVSFQPACVVASPLDLSAAEAIGFVRRQYLIARHYADLWWLAAVAAGAVRTAAWLGTAVAIGCGLAGRGPAPWIPAAVGAALYALGAYRAWLVQDLAAAYFPDRAGSLGPFRRFAVWAAPLASLAEWLLLLSTVLGRQLVWRGIRYRFLPRGKVALAGRDQIRNSEVGIRTSAQRAPGRHSVPAPHSDFRLPTSEFSSNPNP
jgi:hypothetical protein